MSVVEIPLETYTNVGAFGSNAVYATARSTSTGVRVAGNTNLVGQRVPSNYEVSRTALKFDTAFLAGSTINQVNLKMSVFQDFSATDFDVIIKKHDWSGEDPITSGNREAYYDGALAATDDDNIWRNTSGLVTNTYYTSGNLDISNVNISGDTYYSLISSRDKSATPPTGNEFVQIDLTTNTPILVVDYTLPRTIEGVTTISNITTITF